MCARAKLLALFGSVVLTGCVTPTRDDQVTTETEEAPLVVELERIEVARGVLRIDARTENGSADLNVTLGGGCEKARREVGRGIATGAYFVWSFTSDELADVLACGALALDARDGHAHRRAVLSAAMDLLATGEDEAPTLVGREDRSETREAVLTFQGAERSARLEVGDIRVDAEPREGENASFVVAFAALSRAVVTRAPLALDGRPAVMVDVAIAGMHVGDDEIAPGDEPLDETDEGEQEE